MKKFLSLFMLLVCLCCFYGCKNEKNDDEIVFGVVGPFTGSLSTYGDSVRRGVELAVKDLNENGGLLGKKIRCLMEDDQGDSGQVLSAYNKLIDDVDFLFGEVTSGNSEILVAQANSDKVLTIAPCATADGITKGREYIFRTCFLDNSQGKAMAEFAKDGLNIKKVSIAYDEADDYSKGVAKAFKERATELGIEVDFFDGGLKAKDNDQRASIVQKLVDKNSDAIFAPIYYEDAAALAKELRSAEYKKPLLGADGYDGILNQLEGAGDFTPANNVFFSNHYCATEDNIVEFANKFNKAYGSNPTSFAALAYDSVMLVAKAIENANSIDTEKVKEALASIKFDGGLTGDISFDKEGDPIKTICICEYVDGSIRLKTKIKQK